MSNEKPIPCEVIKLQLSDGSFRFAIVMDDFTYYEQQWNGNIRIYRVWKTHTGATKFLKKLRLQRGIV